MFAPLAHASVVFVLAAIAASNTLQVLYPSAAFGFCRLTTTQVLPKDRCGTTVCPSMGQPLIWKQRCVSYTIGARAALQPNIAYLQDAVGAAFAAWQGVTCGTSPAAIGFAATIARGECPIPNYSKVDANANTIVFVDDLAEFNRQWREEAALSNIKDIPPALGPEVIGVTMVYHDTDTGEIVDADIIINESSEDLAICNGLCPDGAFDFQNAVTHEVGHFLGFGHSDVRGSTMSPCATPGEVSKRDLAEDDRSAVCSAYDDNASLRCQASDFRPKRGFSDKCASATQPAMGLPTAAAGPSGGCSTSPSSLGGGASSLLTAVLVLLKRRAPRRRGNGRRVG